MGIPPLLCVVLLYTSISLLPSQVFAAPEKTYGTCISPGGRFPPFLNEGKAPRKVSKGPRDLTLCRVFRQNTCCDVAQTYPAFLSIRRLASTGEASQECLQLWEVLECSSCDPGVSVQPGPPVICVSFCDRLYQACFDAYFSIDGKTQVFVLNHLTILLCYGGKASLDGISELWKASESSIPAKKEGSGAFEDFEQWVKAMPFSERVSWAVGGMVLTGGLMFCKVSLPYNW